MRIGELSTVTGVAVPTIRFYERAGLIPPASRHANGYRAFGSGAVELLRFVQSCRNLGVALAAVKRLVPLLEQPGSGCTAISTTIDQHLEQVRARIRELQQLESKLSELQNACSNGQSIANCGILRELVAGAGERSSMDNQIV